VPGCCEILGSHSGVVEEKMCSLDAVSVDKWFTTFRRIMAPFLSAIEQSAAQLCHNQYFSYILACRRSFFTNVSNIQLYLSLVLAIDRVALSSVTFEKFLYLMNEY
jgi:hypothetical protein